jgi:hypothetical protein
MPPFVVGGVVGGGGGGGGAGAGVAWDDGRHTGPGPSAIVAHAWPTGQLLLLPATQRCSQVANFGPRGPAMPEYSTQARPDAQTIPVPHVSPVPARVGVGVGVGPVCSTGRHT